LRTSELSNPPSGTGVRFVRVDDLRKFLGPRTPLRHASLWRGDLSDTALTSRAIGRGPRGIGDLLLPEDRTVQLLVRDALAEAFAQNGYRVLREGDPYFEQALPVEVEIQTLWTWFQQGAWVSSFYFAAAVDVKSPVAPFEGVRRIESSARRVAVWRGPGSLGAWVDTTHEGLASLTEAARAMIEEALLIGSTGGRAAGDPQR
jgi:hypothetical protein